MDKIRAGYRNLASMWMITVILPGPPGIMPCGGGPIMGIIGGPPIGGAGNMPGLGGPPVIQTLDVSR